MIERLVVSGCSYMEHYTDGNGHTELAKILNIPTAINLAKSGACNDRIIRSISRDSLLTRAPTLYLVGLTFLHRYELPICAERSDDGLWESCTGNMLSRRSSSWRTDIALNEYNSYAALRTHMFYLNESLEKTMYQVLTLINSVKQLGHRIVIFNTAESGADQFLDELRFQLLKTTPEIVGSYKWQSIRYQIDCGAKWSVHDSKLEKYVRHVAPGEHRWLNEFLTNYIHEYKILQ
jgi:hypothetical protein